VKTDAIQFRVPIPRIEFRVRRDGRPRHRLRNAPQVVKFIHDNRLIPDDGREHFGVLLLNSNCLVLGYHEVGVGSPHAVMASPRNIFTAALAVPGTDVILVVHNHVGEPIPSKQDTRLTHLIGHLAHELEFQMADHIIVSMENPRAFYSYALASELRARSKRRRSDQKFDRAIAAGKEKRK
jgi:DNA repair protein RadC